MEDYAPTTLALKEGVWGCLVSSETLNCEGSKAEPPDSTPVSSHSCINQSAPLAARTIDSARLSSTNLSSSFLKCQRRQNYEDDGKLVTVAVQNSHLPFREDRESRGKKCEVLAGAIYIQSAIIRLLMRNILING